MNFREASNSRHTKNLRVNPTEPAPEHLICSHFGIGKEPYPKHKRSNHFILALLHPFPYGIIGSVADIIERKHPDFTSAQESFGKPHRSQVIVNASPTLFIHEKGKPCHLEEEIDICRDPLPIHDTKIIHKAPRLFPCYEPSVVGTLQIIFDPVGTEVRQRFLKKGTKFGCWHHAFSLNPVPCQNFHRSALFQKFQVDAILIIFLLVSLTEHPVSDVGKYGMGDIVEKTCNLLLQRRSFEAQNGKHTDGVVVA